MRSRDTATSPGTHIGLGEWLRAAQSSSHCIPGSTDYQSIAQRQSDTLSRRTMTSLLRELYKPSTFLGLVAVTLNAAAVLAAYKVNTVPVTVCGALGILATM